jgi:predicted dehydrogenase
MPLKIGIVGMGGIGNTHAGVYGKDELSQVVAVCDIIKERADRAAQAHSAPAFYSVKEMLASGIKFDACSMCTAGVENGGDHYVPTMELLEAGIPVLGEKPISNEIEKGREMVALAKKKRLPYAVNLNHRFTPAALRAKQWVEEGRLGKLHIINMTMWIGNPNESSPWFHLRALHPHSIDVMRYFCGDAKSVQAFLMKGEGRTIWSNAQINMHFANDVVGHLTGSYDAGGSFGLERCEVVGSEGRFVLEDACEVLTFYPRRSLEKETYYYLGGMQHFRETFQSRIHRWLEQLAAGVRPEEVDGSGADALAAQEIIEAAIKSHETHAVIDL